MNRRSLLAAVGVSSVAAAFAGCLSLSESSDEQDAESAADGAGDDRTDDDRESENTGDGTTVEPPSDPDDPVGRSVIGSQSSDDPPHRIRLWNLDDERHAVSLEVDSADGSISTGGSYDLAPEAHVAVFLHGRNEFDVTVTVDDTAVDAPDIEATSFDDPCPATELFVLEDGFEATTESEADHC
ncbi:hypothetical protein [Natronorubrum bangense]|uniref:Uncharacterized protein n=2 Tax=Natronorubrum bangense TaxID=61858 RepID=L9WTE8_9EURY|nr:hypothetical protein [Natronorubrum bangense]ELY52749.1 hypothetical protein C494_00867 [Natronorubrum bangense JCM 10635]QCC55199.1 hypothetical protein DV706_12395 [Natronorubrum bangense]